MPATFAVMLILLACASPDRSPDRASRQQAEPPGAAASASVPRPDGDRPYGASAASSSAEPASDGLGYYKAFEVDSRVAPRPGNPAPRYPLVLRVRRVEGEVVVNFVVDTTGHVDTTSISVVASPDPRFSAAAREALVGSRFEPATLGGRKVRQLTAQRFWFRLR
ncbi:MAG TPA: TonB family protein [Gemmatimonadaceae bacterium]|nr:TonB family protein [Gemmatimonadaceae bacterium]